MKNKAEIRPLAVVADSNLIMIEPFVAVAQPAAFRRRVDVDFSLAIHNRTGKYFIGRELLNIADLSLGKTYFWRQAGAKPPSGLLGRIAGRLQHLEIVGRAKYGGLKWLPRRRSKHPLLHLDPFTVPTAVLSARDAVMCHDLGPITHPDLFPADVARVYAHIYAEIVQVGPHLIFVSETVERQFFELFPYAQPTTCRVIHPPVRPGVSVGVTQPAIEVDAPFLLTVGSIGKRKNQAGSIAAFARSGLAARGVYYVLCGGPEPGHEKVQELAAQTPNVILLPYVTDEQLRWLYERASGFVLMSLLEGFGMPVAEAIRRGLVPLVSTGGVLSEVAGDSALDADPYDEGAIAAGLVALFDMSSRERAARMENLKDAVERFDLLHFRAAWRKAIDDILAAY